MENSGTNPGANDDRSFPCPGSADGKYPYPLPMDSAVYKETLVQLQIELMKVQSWVKQSGEKVVLIFEGRDAAGKGGSIKRFQEHFNARYARVVALDKPNELEQGQWYFQRYVAHLPTRGEIVFFDRSWYNRAGVERVMGFCQAEDYQRFIHQVPSLEKSLVESGIHFFKLWFDVSRAEQRQRILARKFDPLKRGKLSPMDFASIQRFDAYTQARDDMFLYTDTRHAPWTVIRSDDKRRARIGAILHVLDNLPYPDKDPLVQAPDPLIVGSVPRMFPMREQ